eukprot:CAMPEP_0115187814 /NCGR_PEP_ID=MMETSP0270-20121206/10688_1 /TAXON_ID=71861 /ORGANISM="Scrippsiella trochoidea, Strain CCMP3099" /LENGTH=66 /DNA_ID=CAMNT_0002600975 /DNA_START=735 /DNA_END=935 /DNA_ORIENTATION=-
MAQEVAAEPEPSNFLLELELSLSRKSISDIKTPICETGSWPSTEEELLQVLSTRPHTVCITSRAAL